MTIFRSLQTCLVLGLISVGCSKGDDQQTEAPPAATPTPAADPAAPDSFRVAMETGKGRIVLEVKRAWAPRGVDRFHALVTSGYYDKVKFFRVIPGFMAQFGISGDPAMNARWGDANIPDDSVKQSNRKGMITYAKTMAPNSRSTQLFINLVDNPNLDGMGFAPFGRVVEGMDVVEKLYGGYGEGAPDGGGPEQGRIGREGNAYLNSAFPKLDSIISARVIK